MSAIHDNYISFYSGEQVQTHLMQQTLLGYIKLN